MANDIRKNDFNNTVNSLFKGMDAFLTSKTVVGEPINVGDTTIIPLMDVNFGVGAGALGQNNCGGGMGGKMSPSSVIVIKNGDLRIVPVAEENALSKVIGMVPQVTDKVKTIIDKKKNVSSKEEAAAVDDAIENLSDTEF